MRRRKRKRRTGLEMAGAGAGAVGALLFAVEGGGSWGRKGGRRIDPDGAWLTADEAVTRDESRRDGRTEKVSPHLPAPSRVAPLSPNGFWRSEPVRWWVVPVGGWQRDGGAYERYCLLPLQSLLTAKQYLDCTYTRSNSSAVAAAVPSMCDTRVMHARVYKVSEKLRRVTWTR